MNARNISPIRSRVPAKFAVIFNGAALWLMLGVACLAFSPATAFGGAVGMGDIMCACPGWSKPLGSASSCEEACGLTSGSSGSAPRYDAEAARRAREAAEAAAIAEQQRLAEEARIERELRADEKRKKEAAAAAEFISGRDAAKNTLKGSSDSAMSQLKGLSGADSGLRGSSFDTGIQQKSAPASSSGDPMVVDARKVPTGLPKNVDNAIARAYSNAPPGVSDRVRKGFQAVTARDWKVAKAWFQDALNRDPDNAGLKRLIALTDPPKQPAPATGTQLQLPDPDYEKDMWIVFPGLKGQTAPAAGTQLQLPDEKDMLLLFPGNTEGQTAPAAGTELQLPGPNDMYLMFPDLEALDEKEAQDILFGLDPQPPTLKSRKTK